MQSQVDALNERLRRTAPAVFDFVQTEAGQAFLDALEQHELTAAAAGLRDTQALPGYWLAYCNAIEAVRTMLRAHGDLKHVRREQERPEPTPAEVRSFLQVGRGGAGTAF